MRNHEKSASGTRLKQGEIVAWVITNWTLVKLYSHCGSIFPWASSGHWYSVARSILAVRLLVDHDRHFAENHAGKVTKWGLSRIDRPGNEVVTGEVPECIGISQRKAVRKRHYTFTQNLKKVGTGKMCVSSGWPLTSAIGLQCQFRSYHFRAWELRNERDSWGLGRIEYTTADKLCAAGLKSVEQTMRRSRRLKEKNSGSASELQTKAEESSKEREDVDIEALASQAFEFITQRTSSNKPSHVASDVPTTEFLALPTEFRKSARE